MSHVTGASRPTERAGRVAGALAAFMAVFHLVAGFLFPMTVGVLLAACAVGLLRRARWGFGFGIAAGVIGALFHLLTLLFAVSSSSPSSTVVYSFWLACDIALLVAVTWKGLAREPAPRSVM